MDAETSPIVRRAWVLCNLTCAFTYFIECRRRHDQSSPIEAPAESLAVIPFQGQIRAPLSESRGFSRPPETERLERLVFHNVDDL